jgi:hypothetical protein
MTVKAKEKTKKKIASYTPECNKKTIKIIKRKYRSLSFAMNQISLSFFICDMERFFSSRLSRWEIQDSKTIKSRF